MPYVPYQAWLAPAQLDEYRRMIRHEQARAALATARGDERRRLAAKQRLVAEEKARELLDACLSPRQRVDMRRFGYFTVTGSRGGRYRIYTGLGYAGNIVQVDDDDCPVFGYCAHAGTPLPVSEHFLLQKLTIEADEPQFRDVALSAPVVTAALRR